MRFSTILGMLAALVVVIVAQAFAATTTSTSLRVSSDLPLVILSVDAATTGDVVATDTGALGRGSKRAQITRRVAGGQTQYVLTRVQHAGGKLWIDEVAALTTTALASRIAAFDFSTASPSHPSPTHDAVDDQASGLMVGYTGS
jgi:hypothetical protein